MLDSDYWKHIGEHFRRVKDGARVNAMWTEVPGHAHLDNWTLLSGGKTSPKLHFETLARRAGSKIDPTGTDSLTSWLSALKREGRRDLVSSGGGIGTYEGPELVYTAAGRIQNVCLVSADYCRALESRALEAKHAARRPDGKADRLAEEPASPVAATATATVSPPLPEAVADGNNGADSTTAVQAEEAGVCGPVDSERTASPTAPAPSRQGGAVGAPSSNSEDASWAYANEGLAAGFATDSRPKAGTGTGSASEHKPDEARTSESEETSARPPILGTLADSSESAGAKEPTADASRSETGDLGGAAPNASGPSTETLEQLSARRCLWLDTKLEGRFSVVELSQTKQVAYNTLAKWRRGEEVRPTTRRRISEALGQLGIGCDYREVP